VPLTTYTFTTGSSSEDPVSATDEERLPPGGFSLRHGFPHWFGRAKRSTTSSVSSSRNVSGGAVGGEPTGVGNKPSADSSGEDKPQSEASVPSTPKGDGENIEAHPASTAPATSPNTTQRVSPTPQGSQFTEFKKDVPVAALLDYIRSTFDDEKILDELPLDAAGNPGAWHAWRAHRRIAKGSGSEPRGTDGSAPDANLKKGSPQARLPGDWNWEGVWEKRVRSGIEASKSDAMLFGNAPRGGGDEMVSVLAPQILQSCRANPGPLVLLWQRLICWCCRSASSTWTKPPWPTSRR